MMARQQPEEEQTLWHTPSVNKEKITDMVFIIEEHGIISGKQTKLTARIPVD